MDLREILRIQLDYWHGMLERMLKGCGADVLRRAQGTVRSIAAIYAHAVIWEDMVVSKLQGAPPVYESGAWSTRVGPHRPGFRR